jgi:hypothetical protein
MSKFNSKSLTAAALAAVLTAGCGGGGGGLGDGGGQVPQAANPSTSAQGVVDFLISLIANDTSGLSEPGATDGVTFATEELAEPSPI